MPTDINEIINEKKKLEDDIYELVSEFEKRNRGTRVNEIIIYKEGVHSCCGDEIVSIHAKVSIT